jgi:archaellum component FlaC
MALVKIKIKAMEGKQKKYHHYRNQNGKFILIHDYLPLNEVIEINAISLTKIENISYDKLGSNGEFVKIEMLKQEMNAVKQDKTKLSNDIVKLKSDHKKELDKKDEKIRELENEILNLKSDLESLTSPTPDTQDVDTVDTDANRKGRPPAQNK